MKKENWITTILDSTTGMKKAVPHAALFSKIENKNPTNAVRFAKNGLACRRIDTDFDCRERRADEKICSQ